MGNLRTGFQGLSGFDWFFAKVEDVSSDPKKIGRIKIRPIGIYSEDIPVKDLPFAVVIQSITSAAQSGMGVSPTGIEVGSFVFGFFVDSDQQQPVVLGSYAGYGDISSLVTGVDDKTKKIQTGPEPVPSFAPVYPLNKVITSKSGHILELDDTPSAERIHIFHKSGSYQEYQPTGLTIDKAVGDKYLITTKNLLTHSDADTISTCDNLIINSTKDSSITSGGTATYSSNKDTTLSSDKMTIIKGGTKVTISADGSVDITASAININGSVAVSGLSFTWNGKTVKAGSISG